MSPSQSDTLTDIKTVLSKVPERDCVCLLGDFNEQLQGGVKGVTGKFTGGPPSANSEKLVDFLRLNKLIAVNTMYQPKDGKNVHTFLSPTTLFFVFVAIIALIAIFIVVGIGYHHCGCNE